MRTKINPDSFGFLISDIGRLSRGVFEREIEAAELPVTAAEARVLAHMARCGATRQHMLAESLGMTPMSLTGFLDRLEAAELIARTADPNDRRAKIASLTPRANDILSQIAQAGARVETIISEGLTPEQWQTFRATALTLRQNLSASRGATPSTTTRCATASSRSSRCSGTPRCATRSRRSITSTSPPCTPTSS